MNNQLHIDLFFHQLSQSRDSLLLLDYDGTLAPFTTNPDETLPYPGVMQRVATIMQSGHTKVIIVSGREISKLKKFLNLSPLPELWGSHGGETLYSGTNHTVESINAQQQELIRGATQIAQKLAPDLYCEIKPLSVALHWRGQPKALIETQAQLIYRKWKESFCIQGFDIHPFDGGIELRSKEISKKNAVEKILQRSPNTPLAYLGDDLADEEVFEVLGNRGLKVLVRKEIRSTKADLQLIPPEELIKFFDKWILNIKK